MWREGGTRGTARQHDAPSFRKVNFTLDCITVFEVNFGNRLLAKCSVRASVRESKEHSPGNLSQKFPSNSALIIHL